MAESSSRVQPSRWLLGFAALLGALGVASAAAASHSGARLLDSVSLICLGHAPAVMALALFGLRTPLLAIAAILLSLGACVFAADLLWREYIGAALLPMLAPLSGGALILGWLTLAFGAVLWRKTTG